MGTKRPRKIGTKPRGGAECGRLQAARIVNASALRRLRARLTVPLLVVAVLAALLLVLRHWPRPPLAAAFSTSRAVVDMQGRLLRLTLADDDKYRLWTPLPAMSPELVEAVLLHEDRHFYLHPGVNPAALLRVACAPTPAARARAGRPSRCNLRRACSSAEHSQPVGQGQADRARGGTGTALLESADPGGVPEPGVTGRTSRAWGRPA